MLVFIFIILNKPQKTQYAMNIKQVNAKMSSEYIFISKQAFVFFQAHLQAENIDKTIIYRIENQTNYKKQ